MNARAILEAETAKRALAAIRAAGGSVEELDAYLRKLGFRKRNSDHLAWTKRFRTVAYAPDRYGDHPLREYTVWWDTAAREWVLKYEGERLVANRWCGWHQLGDSQAFAHTSDLIAELDRYHRYPDELP